MNDTFANVPSSQFLLFTPLPAFLSYTGAQLGVNLGESASLGNIHLVSISKLPLLCLSSNFLHFLHSLGLNIYTSPLASLHFLHSFCFNIQISSRCPSTISCIHLVSYVAPPWPPRNFLQASCLNILKLSHTCASQQLPAFMGFQYLGFSPSSLHNFLHASPFGFNIFALIWFEYLYFPALASLQTSCAHLVSISKIPARCPSTTSCIHPASISKLPPLCLSATSCIHGVSISRLLPLVSAQLPACIVIWVQYLCAHMVWISILPGPSLSTNFLRSSCFNI